MTHTNSPLRYNTIKKGIDVKKKEDEDRRIKKMDSDPVAEEEKNEADAA